MYRGRSGDSHPDAAVAAGVIISRFAAPLLSPNAEAFSRTGEQLLRGCHGRAGKQPASARAVMRSFRGQALEGADFSGSDLRGADLTGADFTGTNVMRCDTRGATVTDVTWDPTSPHPVDLPQAEPGT